MTVINQKSISGITSITMPSGADNVLTIHTTDGTERLRIDSSGNVKVGSAATISPDGDLFVTGVCTATTLSGAASGLTGALPAISGANLTNLAAANLTGTIADGRFPATLPAASAANLTSIPAANVTGTLPALTAANLTNIPAANIVGVATAGFGKTGGFGGITMADSWIINTNFTTGSGESFITSNWSRFSAGNSSGGVIGDAMTESSGLFTFPTTGMYLITTSFSGANGGNYFGVKTRGSTDSFSSSDFDLALSYNSTSSSSQYFEVTAQSIFDVTNVSTHKVKFRYEAQTSTAVNGAAAAMRSGVTFIRIGDT